MAIDKFPLEKIEELLRNSEIQKRIQAYQESIQTEALVTIGRAAKLFGFSETKLREWDRSGYLSSVRSRSGELGGTGQRQYSVAELNKLAIIRVLQDAGISEVPASVDELWKEIVGEHKEERQTIDQHVEKVYQEEFWRFYASRVMQLSLALICGDALNTVAGLVIPLRQSGPAMPVLDAEKPEEFARLGPSLVCFLNESHVFHTFYESVPSFEYLTDFRIRGLASVEEDAPRDRVYVVLQRKMKPTLLDSATVNVIRRLLAPLYEQVTIQEWEEYLGHGFRDVVYAFPDLTRTDDMLLTNLAEELIELGGKTAQGKSRWRFCCIFVPNNPDAPMQLRSLVVLAQSSLSPHQVRSTLVSSEISIPSLSLRAFQSGNVLYRPFVPPAEMLEDSMIAYRALEQPIGSAIAVPVGGEDGNPSAVLYVVSAEPFAFSEEDQILLRITGRMIDELLMTYQMRQKVVSNLNEIVINPAVTDPLFKYFASQNDFLRDVEALLSQIRERKELASDDIVLMPPEEQDGRAALSREVVSFISIDIDDQSYLARKYGDQRVRNLSRFFGDRIQQQVGTLFTQPIECKLYHIYADRYFLMLNHLTLP